MCTLLVRKSGLGPLPPPKRRAGPVQFGPYLAAIFRSFRNHQFHGRRQIGMPAADDAGVASKLEMLVIERDDALRLALRQDLRGRQPEAARHAQAWPAQ